MISSSSSSSPCPLSWVFLCNGGIHGLRHHGTSYLLGFHPLQVHADWRSLIKRWRTGSFSSLLVFSLGQVFIVPFTVIKSFESVNLNLDRYVIALLWMILSRQWPFLQEGPNTERSQRTKHGADIGADFWCLIKRYCSIVHVPSANPLSETFR